MLAWQNVPGQAGTADGGFALGDLRATQLPLDTHTARMDLSFSLAERWDETGQAAGISGTVEFRTDVYDTGTVEALIDRLQRVLTAMAADPTRRLSSIDVVDTEEQVRLDTVGNRAALIHPSPAPASLPALFEAQVARDAGAVAVSFDGSHITYGDLDRAANRLAHLLLERERGAGPAGCGVVVPVGRSGRRDRRGSQNRCGVCTDRPHGARFPIGLRPHRFRAAGGCHHNGPGRSPGGGMS